MNSKDYIGKAVECLIGGEIKIGIIESLCKKKKDYERFWVVVEGAGRLLLRSDKINLKNEKDFFKTRVEQATKRKEQEVERNLFLVEKWKDEFYKTKELDKNHQAALAKNEKLSKILHDKRETMCGVGTRRVKLMLNKRIKQGDKVAELYRKAIEVEDCNIRAKESSFYYKGKIYRQKARLLMDLVDLCLKADVVVGKQMVDGRETNCILYFDLPHVEQISCHTTLEGHELSTIPDYPKQWDGKTCSTLDKLEDTFNELYYNK